MSDAATKAAEALRKRDFTVAEAVANAVSESVFASAQVAFARLCREEMDRTLDSAERGAILRVMERIPEMRLSKDKPPS
jgi:hypothetical protein